jgi:hypothetical protein
MATRCLVGYWAASIVWASSMHNDTCANNLLEDKHQACQESSSQKQVETKRASNADVRIGRVAEIVWSDLLRSNIRPKRIVGNSTLSLPFIHHLFSSSSSEKRLVVYLGISLSGPRPSPSNNVSAKRRKGARSSRRSTCSNST